MSSKYKGFLRDCNLINPKGVFCEIPFSALAGGNNDSVFAVFIEALDLDVFGINKVEFYTTEISGYRKLMSASVNKCKELYGLGSSEIYNLVNG
jgi:hypothetical protein